MLRHEAVGREKILPMFALGMLLLIGGGWFLAHAHAYAHAQSQKAGGDASAPTLAPTIHVHPSLGDDAWNGLSADRSGNDGPVRTFAGAMRLLKPGHALRLAAGQTFRETLHITVGGTPEAPLIIEGQGAIIDLGVDVTQGPWTADGQAWILDRTEPDWGNAAVWQMARLFVGSSAICPIDPRRGALLQPGQCERTAEGKLRVMFPARESPTSGHRIIMTAPFGQSAVAIAGRSNITIRDLTCRYSGNDGVNIHNKAQNIRLHRITAEFNADEGISAHGQSVVEAEDCIVAFNGSQAGGIADVMSSVTTYRRCLIFGNRGQAFYLDGLSHRIEQSVYWGNHTRQSASKAGVAVTLENVIDLDSPASVEQAPESMKSLVERARSIRSRFTSSPEQSSVSR